jgi:hypothetical protein
VSLTPVANLPPVSTTLLKLVAKFAAGVVDTGSQPLAGNISENFQKIRNGPYGFLRGLGETDS